MATVLERRVVKTKQPQGANGERTQAGTTVSASRAELSSGVRNLDGEIHGDGPVTFNFTEGDGTPFVRKECVFRDGTPFTLVDTPEGDPEIAD